MNWIQKSMVINRKSIAFILFGIGIMAVTSPLAGESLSIQEIKPVPEVFSVEPGLPEEKQSGTLEQMNPDGVTIGGVYYKFSQSVLFLTPWGTSVTELNLEKSRLVYFQLNSKNEIIVMWPHSNL